MRAPVKGLSGEWQVDSARPQEEPYSPHVHDSASAVCGSSVREKCVK